MDPKIRTMEELIDWAEKMRDDPCFADDTAYIRYWVGYIDGAKALKREIEKVVRQWQSS